MLFRQNATNHHIEFFDMDVWRRPTEEDIAGWSEKNRSDYAKRVVSILTHPLEEEK
jgi:hypothetical protein